MPAISPDSEIQHRTRCLPTGREEERNSPALPENVTSAGLGLARGGRMPTTASTAGSVDSSLCYLGKHPPQGLLLPAGMGSHLAQCSHIAEKVPV